MSVIRPEIIAAPTPRSASPLKVAAFILPASSFFSDFSAFSFFAPRATNGSASARIRAQRKDRRLRGMADLEGLLGRGLEVEVHLERRVGVRLRERREGRGRLHRGDRCVV